MTSHTIIQTGAERLTVNWGPGAAGGTTPGVLLTAWAPEPAPGVDDWHPLIAYALDRDELDALVANLSEARRQVFGDPTAISALPVDWSRVSINELAARDPDGFERAVRRSMLRNGLLPLPSRQ